MTQPRLAYFDFPGGRGEDCRLALHLAGVDFVDDRVAGDWGERKPGTPWGGLPVYTDEQGRELGQSNAILAYLGRKHGLHPTDPFEAARQESVMMAMEELRAALPGMGLSDEEKKPARAAFVTDFLTPWATRLERQIRGPFVGGETLTVADLKLFVGLGFYLGGKVDHVASTVFDAWPKLPALHAAVGADPRVQSWYAR